MNAEIWRDFLPAEEGGPFVLLEGEPPRPGLWWLPDEPPILQHWAPILRNNFDYLVHLVEEAGDASRTRRAEEARKVFRALLDDLLVGDAREDVPTIHHVTLFRESVVRAFELGDPYRAVKQRETDSALERLLSNPSEWGLGERGSGERCEPVRILLQLLSGNLFDLGSALTQKAFREGRMDLEAAKTSVWDRLTEIDAAGSRELVRHGWRNWFSGGEPADTRRLLILADNAGADFVLGILPLASCLAEEWDEVVLAANSHPSSNDITVTEAQEVLERAKNLLGPLLEPGRLKLVGTGTGTPGIDLAHVGESFNAIAKNSNAVILEGQGRGAETTWGARFRVPVVRLAVLKDPEVAAAIGRRLWDPLVVRQLPGLQAAAPKRHQDR